MPPHSVQPGSNSPPPSFRYSSTEYIIIRVSETDDRSWPTRPAEWNVEPLVSSRRSSRTTSRQPSSARWNAMDVPATPPPMITHRARGGGSRATRVLEPAREVLVRQAGAHLAQVLVGVAEEVEVQLRAGRLDDAPHPLPERRHRPHQLDPGEPAGRRRAEVRL